MSKDILQIQAEGNLLEAETEKLRTEGMALFDRSSQMFKESWGWFAVNWVAIIGLNVATYLGKATTHPTFRSIFLGFTLMIFGYTLFIQIIPRQIKIHRNLKRARQLTKRATELNKDVLELRAAAARLRES